MPHKKYLITFIKKTQFLFTLLHQFFSCTLYNSVYFINSRYFIPIVRSVILMNFFLYRILIKKKVPCINNRVPFFIEPFKIEIENYFTIIFIFAFFLLNVFTVMIAVPFFFAVTFPAEETFATDFLLEE